MIQLSLTAKLDDSFRYEEKVFHLNLAFDTVLRVFDLFSDDLFLIFEKIDIALEMLVKEYEQIEGWKIDEKNQLLIFIFREFIGIDLEQEDTEVEQTKRLYDFKQDAGIIYASFLNCYQMDLYNQQGKLHWVKFLSLLENLAKDTAFKEVVKIRGMDVPKADKYNKEYRKQIIELKRLYNLDQSKSIDTEQEEEQLNKQFSAIAESLKRKQNK